MSAVVDTRIVEAKFDSAQFEKGVNKTVKKLDELKKSLSLENTGKSITQLADKTKEATEKASDALDKLQHRFTDFAGMLKQKLLSGIADEIVGVVFKIKNAFEGLVHSLGSAQVSYGMQRYVDIMGSVRTLVFSGVEQETAYKTIERLGTYADQTSYSLDQLVSTMSKFKTAGASLSTAERMVIGLSNAAASMGVNSNDAARAYLNLQQAYSKGAMLQNDWISFESLPMVGEKFNQKILEAADHIGTLQKQADGTYKTVNKIDKQVKTSGADSKGITAQNLGTKLSSRWFNKAVMEEVFGSTYYFNVLEYDEIDKQGNKITVDASRAARRIKDYEEGIKSTTTQVKKEQADLQKALEQGNITREQYAEQLSNAAVDKAYENLDRDFKEHAPDINDVKKELKKYLETNGYEKVDYEDLYTKQFEIYLDTIEEKMLENKKAELDEAFKEGTITAEEYKKALDDFTLHNNLTRFGWEAYRAGQEARSFTDVINTLKDAISRGWAKSFEIIFGKLDEASKFFTALADSELASAIYSIAEFRNGILEVWSETGGRDALLEGLQNLDELLGRILGRFHIFNSENEGFQDNVDSLGDILTKNTKKFANFTSKLNDWFTDDRIDRIHRIFKTISSVIKTFTRSAGIGISFAIKMFDTFSPVLETVIDNVDMIITRINSIFSTGNPSETADGLGVIKTGLNDVLIAVQPLVKPLEDLINIIGGVVSFFAELAAGTFVSNVSFFTDTLEFIIAILGGTPASGKSTLLEALATAVEKLGNACSKAFGFVTGFFHNLYEDLLILFGLKERAPDSEGGYFENLSKYFDGNQFLTNIKNWFKKIPEEITKLWNMVDEFLFGKKVTIKKPNQKTETTVRIKQGFSKWIDTAIKDVKKWITKELPKEISKIWDTIDDFFFGKKVKIKKPNQQSETTIRIRQGFSKWLDTAVKDVERWILDLPTAIADLWNKIIDVIFYTDADPNAINPETNEKFGPGARIKNGFLLWIEALPGKIWTWITTDLPNIVKDIWSNVLDFIIGPKVDEKLIGTPIPGTDKKYGPNDRVLTGFAKWISNLPHNIWNWITTDLPTIVTKIWNNVLDFVVGPKVDDKLVGTPIPGTDETYAPNDRVKTGFAKWIENIAKEVVNWASSWHDNVRTIWNTVLDAIFGNASSDIEFDKKLYTMILRTEGRGEAEKYRKSTEKPILIQVTDFVKNLGIDIGKIIADLPKYIVEGWNFSLDLFSSLIEHLTGWFENNNSISEVIADETGAAAEEAAEEISGDQNDSTFLGAVLKLGGNIARIFQDTLPKFFTEAWTYISNPVNSGSLLDSVTALLDINPADIDTVIRNAGDTISGNIRKLPNYIRTAFDTIKNLFDPRQQEIASVRKSLEDQFKKGLISQEDFERYSKYAEQSILHGPKKQSPLVEAIKSIFGATGDLIKDIGPDILNAIDSVLQWLGEKISKVTEIFADKQEGESIPEAVARHMAADKNSEEKPNGLVTALSNIGQTLYDLITTIIPDFIKAGISVLIDEVPKLISGISTSLFGEGSNLKEQTESSGEAFLEQMANNTGVMGDIVRNMPDSEAGISKLNLLGVLDSKKQELEFMMKYADESSEEYKQLSEQYTKLNKAIEKANSLSDEEIRLTDLGLTDKELALRTRVKRVDRVAELEQIYKNKSDAYYATIRKLQNWMGAFDQSSYKENPEFLRAEADYLEAKNALNEIKSKNDEWVYLDDDALKNEDSGIKQITNIFDTLINFGTSKTTQAIGIIAAIAWAIHELKDVFSLTDEVESFGYSAKWTGISIMIAGITLIMGYITYLAALQDSSRIDKVMETFDKLTSFIERLGALFETIAWIKLGTSGFDALGSLFGWRGDKASLNAAKATGEAVGSASGLVTFFTNLASSLGTTLVKYGLITTGSDAIGAAIESIFSSLADTFSIVTEVIDNVMTFIGPAIEKAASLKSNLDDAIDVMEGLGELIGKFYHIIDLKAIFAWAPGNADADASIISDDRDVSALEMVDSNLEYEIEKRVSIITRITSLLDNLSLALKNMQDVEDVSAQMEKISNAVDLMDPIIGKLINTVYNHLAEKWVEMGGTLDFNTMDVAEGFQILGNAMSILSAGISDLSTENVTALSGSIDVIDRLLGAIDGNNVGQPSALGKVISGDKSLSAFGREIKLFGSRLKDFFEYVKDLPGTKDEEYIRTQRSIDFIIQISKGLAEATNVLSEASGKANIDEVINDWSKKLPGFAANLGAFVRQINANLGENIDVERMQMIKDGAAAYLDLARSVHELSTYTVYPEKIPQVFSSFMQALAENLADPNNSENTFYNVAFAASESIYDGFITGVDSDKMYKFGENLIIGLKNGITDHIENVVKAMEEVATAVSKTFTVKMEIHSPSEVFKRYGKNTDEGLAMGIEENSNLPAEAMGRTAEEVIEYYKSVLDDPNADKQNKDAAKRILDSLFLDPSYMMGAKTRIKQDTEELQKAVQDENNAIISAISEVYYNNLTAKPLDIGKLIETTWNVVTHPNGARRAAAQGPAQRFAYYLGNFLGYAATEYGEDAQSGFLSTVTNSKLFDVLMTGVIPEFGTSIIAKMIKYTHAPSDLDVDQGKLDEYANFKWSDVVTWIANHYLKDVLPNVYTALNENGGFDFTADNFDFKKALFPFISGLLTDISEMTDDEQVQKACSVLNNFVSKIFNMGLGDDDSWRIENVKQNAKDNIGEFIDSIYSIASDYIDDPRITGAFSFGKLIANLFTGKGIFGGGVFDSVLGETSAAVGSINNEFMSFGSNISNMFGGLLDLPEDALDLSPKVTPVLEITDDFKAEAERVNSLLDPNNGSIGGGGGSINMPDTTLNLASQLDIPKPIDYTMDLYQIRSGIEDLQSGIRSVGSRLSSMRFVIQGKEMAWTIGPDIMDYIGYEQTAGPGRYT